MNSYRLIIACIVLSCAQLRARALYLEGTGASLPNVVYQDAKVLYAFENSQVSVSYVASGSGSGKAAISDGTVDFAGSDSSISDSMYASTPDLQMFPTVATAVVPIYNVPGISELVLERDVLSLIFDGVITHWNDARITADNENMPNEEIKIIVRKKKSGTTKVFSQALLHFLPSFSQPPGDTVSWQVPDARRIDASSNSILIAHVVSTPYTIAYTVLADSVDKDLPHAKLKESNTTAEAVGATPDSIKQAILGNASEPLEFDDRFMASLIGGGGNTAAWPISTFTYLVLRKHSGSTADECVRKRATLQYWKWFYTSDAVAGAAELHYFVTLPNEIAGRVIDMFYNEVTCMSAPALLRDENVRLPPLNILGDKADAPLFGLLRNGFRAHPLSATRDLRFISGDVETIDEFAGARYYDFAVFSVAVSRQLESSHPGKYVFAPFQSLAIQFAYNLPSVASQQLEIHEDAIRGILDGSICKWNDRRLQNSQPPGVTLPDADIELVIPDKGVQNPMMSELMDSLYRGETGHALTPCKSRAETSQARMAAVVLTIENAAAFTVAPDKKSKLAAVKFENRNTIAAVAPSIEALDACNKDMNDNECYRLQNRQVLVTTRRYPVRTTVQECMNENGAIAGMFAWLLDPANVAESVNAFKHEFLGSVDGVDYGIQVMCGTTSIVDPSSSVIDELVVSSAGMRAAVFALGALGIAVSSALIAFNTYHRSLPYMKISSPMMNNVILLGSLLGYVSLILDAVEAEGEDAFAAQCTAHIFLLTIAFTMSFGGLFTKQNRIANIFNQKKMKVMKISDLQLVGNVGALLFADVILLTLWIIMEPPGMHRHDLARFAIKTDIGDQQMQQYENVCFKQKFNSFFLLLLISKGALMMRGAWLAYKTSNVEIPAINDSRQIGLAIYSTTMIALIVIPVSHFLSGQPDANLMFVSALITISMFATMGLLFFDKIRVVLWGDPHNVDFTASTGGTYHARRKGTGPTITMTGAGADTEI